MHREPRVGRRECPHTRNKPEDPIITLVTDFGLQDGYVGSVKGVILTICRRVRMVDISHMIPSGDIRSGAYVLGSAYRHFPAGSIHVGVVDPGVGSSRAALAIQAGMHTFLGPDNGLFSWVLHRESGWKCRSLANADLWRPEVSRTFHGRDIFAPVAAHLANGFPFEGLGPAHDPIVSTWVKATVIAGGVRGEVIHVDRFGNVVTNVRDKDLGAALPHSEWRIVAGGLSVAGVVGTYGEGPTGTPVALLGSSGHLEIAVNGGDASRLLGLCPGDPVLVEGVRRG